MSSELLPHDVIIEILSWLPPEKLLKFSSVCKAWHSTIRNPKFIVEHHKSHFGNFKENLNNNNAGRIVIASRKDLHASFDSFSLKFSLVQDGYPKTVLYDIMESNSEVSLFHSIMESNFDSIRKSELDVRQIYGSVVYSMGWKFFGLLCNIKSSCNGLFCGASDRVDDGPILLCNPSIRRTTLVPPFCFNKEIPVQRGIDYCYGVGFDRVALDYKVIKFIGRIINCSLRRANSCRRLAVYSVKEKSWKIVNNVSVPHDEIFTDLQSFFLHDFIHWLAFSPKYKIILFDVCNNVFKEMQLPEAIKGNEISIYMVKDSVCLLENEIIDDEMRQQRDYGKICHVWMMKEYGVTESWTKQLSIVLTNGIYTPIKSTVRVSEPWTKQPNIVLTNRVGRRIKPTSGGKFLLCAENPGELDQLILYDPETDEYTSLGPSHDPTLEQVCKQNLCPLVATLELLDVMI